MCRARQYSRARADARVAGGIVSPLDLLTLDLLTFDGRAEKALLRACGGAIIATDADLVRMEHDVKLLPLSIRRSSRGNLSAGVCTAHLSRHALMQGDGARPPV